LLLSLAVLVLLAAGPGFPSSPQTSVPAPAPVPPAPSPVYVPLSEFANRPPSRLVGVEVKLTYLSEQTIPTPSVVFHPFQTLPDLAAFVPFRSSGLSYTNDELPRVESFAVQLAELKAMLQAANAISAVQQGRRDGKYLSFMVVDRTPGQVKGLEVVLNKPDAVALVTALKGAASPGNGLAVQVLGSLLTRLS
jgi:hypothetical protein